MAQTQPLGHVGSPLLNPKENATADQQTVDIPDLQHQINEAFSDESESHQIEENNSEENNKSQSEKMEQEQSMSQSNQMEKDKITTQSEQLKIEPDGGNDVSEGTAPETRSLNSTGMIRSEDTVPERRSLSTCIIPSDEKTVPETSNLNSTGKIPSEDTVAETRSLSTETMPSEDTVHEKKNLSTGTIPPADAVPEMSSFSAGMMPSENTVPEKRSFSTGTMPSEEAAPEKRSFSTGTMPSEEAAPETERSFSTGTMPSKEAVPETRSFSAGMLAPSSALAFGFTGMALALPHKAKLEEKSATGEGEIPQKNVTFSEVEESHPKQRRKGVWNTGVDHSKLGEMMKEIEGFGDQKESGSLRDGLSKKELFNALQSKPLFVQLKELDRNDMGGEQSDTLNAGASWKSKARWIKFEENWEEGANRWSKPHVASLTFHSLPQLRRSLENGLIMLNVTETSLPNIFNVLVDGLVRMELIEPKNQGAIQGMLHLNYGRSSKKSSDHWRSLHGNVVAVGLMSGLAGMSRHNNSSDNLTDKESLPVSTTETNCSNNAVHSPDEAHIEMPEIHASSSQNNNKSATHHHHISPREGIMRKLPEDSEGAMVMVATDDSLKSPVAALVRLVDPPVFDNFLEAPIPLRFIFFLVGPDDDNENYHEVGRAMATLFSDEIFRDIAYAAQDEQDLLNGINGFLNDTMVLPPGEWDKDLLLPITRHQKREQEKVMQKRKTFCPLQMEQDAEEILKMLQEAQKHHDPLERTGRLFGGLIDDVKRRLPHYKSDVTDGINFQCLAAFVFIYFACLSPAISFGGLLGKKTDNWMGVSEMIISTSLCGMIFALFSGQPLVMLGGTGPVLIFEEYLYKFCKEIDIDFMAFRTWIGFWICILATLVVMFEGSILVRHFTRFTEEIFSTLISIIFIYETYKGLKYITCANPILPNYCFDEVHFTVIEKVLNGSNWSSSNTESVYYTDSPTTEYADGTDYDKHNGHYNCDYGNTTADKYAHDEDDHGCSAGKTPHPNTALFSIILTFGTFFISFFLRIFRHSPFLGRTARKALGNFGIAIAILAMVTLNYIVGDIYTDLIKMVDGFHPTDPCKRGWLINPMGQKKTLPIAAIFGAIVPAFLVFILLYMETLLIGMVVNKERNKLRKGSGYHLDLFLIGVLSALAGLMGVPWMCAAPLRTVSHISSLTVLTRKQAPGVKPKLDHIKDQRVTNFAVSFLIGLSTLLAPLLQEIPIAALLGVFLYLGVTSLSGLQFIERLKILFMPRKHHPDVRYIRMVKVRKMHLFTIIQVVCLMVLWVIKNSIIAMAFPFFLILLVVIRILLKYVFPQQELDALDSEEEDEDAEQQIFDCDLG